MRSFIDRIPDLVRREQSREAVPKGVESPSFGPAPMRFESFWEELEQTLSRQNWPAGEHYSLTDAAYTPYVVRFEHLELFALFNTRPALKDWFERVRARPRFHVAIENWLNSKHLELMAEKTSRPGQRCSRF